MLKNNSGKILRSIFIIKPTHFYKHRKLTVYSNSQHYNVRSHRGASSQVCWPGVFTTCACKAMSGNKAEQQNFTMKHS